MHIPARFMQLVREIRVDNFGAWGTRHVFQQMGSEAESRKQNAPPLSFELVIPVPPTSAPNAMCAT